MWELVVAYYDLEDDARLGPLCRRPDGRRVQQLISAVVGGSGQQRA